MKSIVWIVCAALLAGCGGDASPTGTGGSVWTASSVGTGGDGGMSPASATATTGTGTELTSIGEPKCAGTWKLTAPIYKESVTAQQVPIVEDGALALLRIVPAVTPWIATDVTYTLGLALGYCVNLDHDVVTWAGPSGQAPSAHPVGAVVTHVLASEHGTVKGLVPVTVALSAPVTIAAGEALYVGVKLRALASDQRTCIRTCDGGGVDPDSYWSAIEPATGLPGDCPASDCGTLLLSESPTVAEAHANGSDDKRIVISAHGHP